MDMFHSISLVLLTAFCASSFTDARAAGRITDAPFVTRSEVIAPHAMAATSQPLATQIALDVMKQGGTAVDAAIAADAALGLMEPTGAGIGGDLFAIVWDAKTKRLYGLNARGRSPKSLSYVALKAEVHRRGLEEIRSLIRCRSAYPARWTGGFCCTSDSADCRCGRSFRHRSVMRVKAFRSAM
jgi:gamma-glutamyltranspeptidase/glutathione hydrolase